MLQERSSPVQKTLAKTDLPENFPAPPEKLAGAGNWGDTLTRWWHDVVQVIEREREQTASPINDTVNAVAAMQSAQKEIAAALASLQKQAELLEEAIDGLDAGALAKHAADTKTHGADGEIVGTNNEQSLERKQIGVNHPRRGFFTHLASSNSVPAGTKESVPAGMHRVVCGEFACAGTLEVGGTMVFL